MKPAGWDRRSVASPPNMLDASGLTGTQRMLAFGQTLWYKARTKPGEAYVHWSVRTTSIQRPGLRVRVSKAIVFELEAGLDRARRIASGPEAEPLDGAETAVVLARGGPPLGDMCANRTAPTGFDHRCDRLGRAPVTSASTLASDRFRTPPRSPRLAAVRVVQSW